MPRSGRGDYPRVAACDSPRRLLFATPLSVQAMDELIYPTAHGMCAEGTPFRGVIFAGLMIKEGRVRGGSGSLHPTRQGVSMHPFRQAGRQAAGNADAHALLPRLHRVPRPCRAP